MEAKLFPFQHNMVIYNKLLESYLSKYITSHSEHKHFFYGFCFSFCCAEVNSSALILPNIARLTANDTHTTPPSILREVNLANI